MCPQVLVDLPDVFVKSGTAFFPDSLLLGGGLFAADGAAWRRQRQLANPAFRRAAIERYAKVRVIAVVRELKVHGCVRLLRP